MISTRKKKKKVRRKAKAQPVYLTELELLELLKTAQDHSYGFWMFLLVTYWHGLRVSEALALRRGDVVDGYITVQRLKGSLKTRQKIVQHEDALLNETALIGYLSRWKPKDKIFPWSRRQADRLIKKYGELAGLPRHKCHMHVLKHSQGK